MPHRKPPNPNLDQDPDVAEILSKSLAAMRLADDKKREIRWRVMLQDQRKKQAALAVQKDIEAKRRAHSEEMEERQAEYRYQKQLALKTLGPFVALPAESKPLALKLGTNESNSKAIGEYFALTQVNRQIRAEFMPLNRKHIARATMGPWDVAHFIRTFFPWDEMDDERPSAAIKVKIIINLNPFMGCVYDHIQIPTLDLKPLLELATYLPEIFFSFILPPGPKRKLGYENRRDIPLKQVQRLFDVSQDQGPGSSWAFFLAFVRRCKLSCTAAGKFMLDFVTDELFPVTDVASWLDTWGFMWDSASLAPLNAMETFWGENIWTYFNYKRSEVINVTYGLEKHQEPSEPSTAKSDVFNG
ncbi:hypothetical protein P171DRAFT_476756 [Karstenula rhodostoma CBS 690.94]|uniref:Uncharacterized protein n=1 Tax=Karstenula rhodostoma CBS 690.94 TaxID=1392251 RepID=A0A9P4P967_9PLEO|nr:hypothetical protein P171DRAFT_476756 [Karstenula rhodostoma CBS 690.94]